MSNTTEEKRFFFYSWTTGVLDGLNFGSGVAQCNRGFSLAGVTEAICRDQKKICSILFYNEISQEQYEDMIKLVNNLRGTAGAVVVDLGKVNKPVLSVVPEKKVDDPKPAG